MPILYPVLSIILVLLTTAGVMKFRADQKQKIDTTSGIMNTAPGAPFDEYALKIGTFLPDQQSPIPTFPPEKRINPKITRTPQIHINDDGTQTSEDAPSSANCTLTIGFWKTHAGFGPQADVLSQYLPIWLGNKEGEATVKVIVNSQAVDLLNKMDDASNGFNRLYAQLLGAKLNVVSGATDEEVAGYFTSADNILAQYNAKDWTLITDSMRENVSNLAGTFDEYNNGIIGPGHCP